MTGVMQAGARLCVLGIAALAGLTAGAQELPPLSLSAPAVVVTLDQHRLFEESAYGRAVIARFEAEKAALLAENRRIEAELEQEERALTERRQSMTPEEFAPLAAAFDARVVEIRATQDAKSEALSATRERDEQEAFQAALPVLARLLQDSGAVAILADDAVILSLAAVDITDRAIARLDVELPPPAPDGDRDDEDPAPQEATPDTAPAPPPP